MKRITFNLAGQRRINGPAFALRAVPLALAALLLAGLAASRFSGLAGGGSGPQPGAGASRQRLDEIRSQGARLRSEIAARRQALNPKLAWANLLITRKSFSFIRRLDFLETVCGPGIRVRQITLENDRDGRVALSIAAESLKELFALYKRLAPFGLAISAETQTGDEYLVKLSFAIADE